MKIFLDLDGTVVNFVKGAFQSHNKELPVKVNHNFWKDWGLSNNQFWSVIDKDIDFWANLEPMPWFNTMIDIVKDYDPNFYILTAPALHENCYFGKRRWVVKHFGLYYDRLIICSDKHLVINGHKDHVLIDDNEKYEKDIDEANFILFPAIQNRLNYLLDNPMPYLRKELEKRWESV